MSPMGKMPLWLKKEVMLIQKRKMKLIEEEDMVELINVIKKLEPPKGDAKTLTFIIKN